MISRRFALPLTLLLLVAFVPTLRHGYIGNAAVSEPLSPTVLPARLGESPGRERPRSAAWMQRTYAAHGWAERIYNVPGHGTLNLFVARGFDHKKLYHHPELGVLRGRGFKPLRSARLPDGRPVHVLEAAADGADSAVYALVYGERWIANPFTFQVTSALTSLWQGRKPLTLVLVYGPGAVQDAEPSPAATTLMTAVATAAPE